MIGQWFLGYSVIHVSKIGCVNIPGTDSHYPYAFHVFIPTSSSSFTMFHPWIFPPTMPLGHCIEVICAAKRLCPSAGSPLLCVPFFSRDPRVFCLGSTADIGRGPFPYITSIDRRADCRIWRVETMCGKRCFILLIGSHVKDMDELETLMFQQTCPKITALKFQRNFEDGNLRL